MKLSRPAYVLGHNADQSGCGHHRIINPLGNLARLGVMIGRCDMQMWQPDVLRLMAPDVVIWQRQNEEFQIANMARYRETLPDASIVYEIDDALWAVPTWSYHAPYIPHDIEARIARAVQTCDVITVSTRCLAREMRRICGDKLPVRVVPNMLGKPEFERTKNVRLASRRPHPRPRVGWGGGISHTGDLALIRAVIDAIGDRVEWVFLGMRPEGVSQPVEFHQGVQPTDYLPTLASLDLDLMLAPLEDNLFNRCKSNLRLIEAGACHYPVIASPVEPYVENNPPIRYANTTEEWIEEIEAFLRHHGDGGEALAQWAERHYCFDTKAEERAAAWLKGSAKPFKPHFRTQPSGFTIVCPQPQPHQAELGNIETNLHRACDGTGHVLYIAPYTHVTKAMIERMLKHLENENVACATALSNNGGIAGFPTQWQYVPVQIDLGDKIDAICADMFDRKEFLLPFATGAFIGLNKRVIDQIGLPAPAQAGLELASIIEWSMLAVTRGKRVRAAADIFAAVLTSPPPFDVQMLLRRGQMRYPPPNLPADPLADVRGRIERTFHRLHYATPVPSGRPGYQEWTALFDTLGSRDEDGMLASQGTFEQPRLAMHLQPGLTVEPQVWGPYAKIDAKTLRCGLLPQMENQADWCVFARSDAIVRAHAFHMIAKTIAENPELRLVYADHDYITSGQRGEHDCKPHAFDHDMLLGRDYITPIFAVHRSLLAALGEHDLTDTDLYGLVLDAVRHAGQNEIGHVDRILAHLRGFNAEKEIARAKRNVGAVERHLAAMSWPASVAPHPMNPRYLSVSWKVAEPAPLVSIIVPTKDRRDMLQPCLDSLLARTEYPNYEVLLIDNGSTNPEHRQYVEEIQQKSPRVRCIPWNHDYNWSALNNFAAGFAKGDYLLFLNDDTRFVDGRWLTEMVGSAQRGRIGAVGARLLYPFGMVQHVGVACQNGMTGHIHKGLPDGHAGYNGYALISHEATAVTGACLLVRRELFDEAGRFDERMPHNFNDVAFCCKLIELGYVNVVAAGAVVQHIEGATRPNLGDDGARERMQAEGRILQSLFPKPDPYWNKHFMLVHHDGGTLVSGMNLDTFSWPGRPWPWRQQPGFEPERVLVIGDDGSHYACEARDGNAVYAAGVNGFQLQIVQPPLQNVAPFDVRYPERAAPLLRELGVGRVVLRSLVGAPIELLGFLTRLGMVVEYAPLTPEAVCPRLNFKVGEEDCGEGYRRGQCADCIDKNGSPFGHVSMTGWIDAWRKFLNEVTLDDGDLDDAGRAALGHVFADDAGGPADAL